MNWYRAKNNADSTYLFTGLDLATYTANRDAKAVGVFKRPIEALAVRLYITDAQGW